MARFVQATATGVTAFYDIDTPVTLAKLERGDFEYLSPDGDPRLRHLSFVHRRPDAGSHRAALRLACRPGALLFGRSRAVRADRTCRSAGTSPISAPTAPIASPRWSGCCWTPPARCRVCRFCVAGPQYPAGIDWPDNVERIEHLPPAEHAAVLLRLPLHPERDARRHDRRRLVALGAAVRGRRHAARRSCRTSGRGSTACSPRAGRSLLARDGASR